MYLVNAAEMRELDRQTIEQLGIPSIVLMEMAGRAVAEEVIRRTRQGQKVTVLAGHGHNGGDGLVAARHLKNAGYDVSVYFVGNEERMSHETMVFWKACERLGITMIDHEKGSLPLESLLAQTDVIVDAMLGIGIQGDVRPKLAHVIRLVNRAAVPFVVAVDVPSGVHTDTGAVCGDEAIRAHCTVTFAFPKWCHYLAPAVQLTGDCIVADIGIPKSFASRYPIRTYVTERTMWRDALTVRSPFTHKGTYGHVLVVGGSRGMSGAPTLTAHAVLKSGAGRVTTAVPHGIQDVVASNLAEGMTWGLGEMETPKMTADTSLQIVERLHMYDVIAVGPGLGRFTGDLKWLQTLLSAADCPVVLDADALNMLSDNVAMMKGCRVPVVLTPHPGEMARLLKMDIPEVERNRPQAAKQLAELTGATVVLKGRYTLTATPNGTIYVNPTGTPAMAKGGSGDVLTGIIAGLLAQPLAEEMVVPLAVYVHGYAGQLAAERHSQFSVLASDLIHSIGAALHSVMSGEASAH